MSDIWNKTVDGAFRGAKWGLILGAAGGAFGGLASPPRVVEQYLMYSFGAAAEFAVIGGLATMAIGAVIGAVAGAIYGALQKSPEEKRHEQERKTARAMAKGRGREKAVASEKAYEREKNYASEKAAVSERAAVIEKDYSYERDNQLPPQQPLETYSSNEPEPRQNRAKLLPYQIAQQQPIQQPGQPQLPGQLPQAEQQPDVSYRERMRQSQQAQNTGPYR